MTISSEIQARLEALGREPRGQKALSQVLIEPKSYLNKTGWIESIARRSPMFEGEAVPWFNYGFVRFLRGRVKKDMEVFEYGSGYSTKWWEAHCASVHAIEHEAGWAEIVLKLLGPRATVESIPLDYDGDYCRAIARTAKKYDIVVIDGRDRANCLRQAGSSLTEKGVIVFDNSQRAHYREAIETFKSDRSYREIQFSGVAPMTHVESFTSILYGPSNCFMI